MVIDLSGGTSVVNYPVHYTDTPPNLDNDTCRRNELWLRRVPAGKFLMGSPSDGTHHEVTLTKSYYIGVFECTGSQYWLVMNTNPSRYSNGAENDRRPAEMLSYNAIRGENAIVGNQTFMGRMAAKTGLTFDLPTEAQWEYAARGGKQLNAFPTIYSGSDNLTEVAWYGNNSTTHDVGKKKPNALGLYDMSGNVYEWCLDWYGDYGTDALTDPTGPTTGTKRVLRGGSHLSEASKCRVWDRFGHNPIYSDLHGVSFGFRVVCLP